MKLIWGYVSIVFASWKSGKTSSEHFVNSFWQHSSTLSIMIVYRSFRITRSSYSFKEVSEYARSLKIFKQLVDGGFLENNRHLVASYIPCDDIPQLLRDTCSMTKLQKLNLLQCDLKLEQLLRVFRSCPELTELHCELPVSEKLEMDGNLINVLRQGFQRLRRTYGNSWPVIQDMLT